MAETVNFDSFSPGALPPEWVCGVTGSGGSRWLVEASADAPSKPNVVRQSGVGDFPWCALKGASMADPARDLFRRPRRYRAAPRAIRCPGARLRRRGAMARALANDPPLILADEPTGNLDSKSGQMIYELLREIARERTVIVVTHAEALAGMSDRVVPIKDGKLAS